jgi:hypothetical protein
LSKLKSGIAVLDSNNTHARRFARFPRTGLIWGSSRGFEPWAAIEPCRVPRGVYLLFSTPSKFGEAKKPPISA